MNEPYTARADRLGEIDHLTERLSATPLAEVQPQVCRKLAQPGDDIRGGRAIGWC